VCRECHAADITDASFAESRRTRIGDLVCTGCHDAPAAGAGSGRGIAPGYKLAMHGLCIECHRQHQAEAGAEVPYMTRCSCCHQDMADEHRQVSRATRVADAMELRE
jgi:hypothetical protein